MSSRGATIFDNCSRHFSIEDNFRECVNASDPCRMIQDISTAYSILKWFGFYSSAVVCLLVVVVDAYCLFVTIRMFRKMREETRKRYICVLVRLFSSILVAVCMIVVQSTIFIDVSFRHSFTFYAVFFVIYDFSIFSLLGSFIGVAVSTYFGVMRPLVYRKRFSIGTMYFIAVAIWTVSLLISIPLGLFQAADTIDGPIRCDSSTCQLIVKWLVFSITCVILLSALSTLTFVTVSLYWHHYKSKKMGNLAHSASDHGRSRLAWTTAILVSLCFVELVPTGVLIGFEEYGFLNNCDNFYRADHLIVPAIVSSFESFIGALAFFLDPIINFFFDRHISREVASHWECVKKMLSDSGGHLSEEDQQNDSSSIFSKCEKHYDIEVLFEQCVNATRPCQAIQDLETAITIVYVDYYSSTVLFCVAGLLQIYLLFVTIPLFGRMQEVSRKKYVFLVSRCVASLLAAVAWLLVQCIFVRFIPPTPSNYPFYVVALTLYDASVYGLLGSYVGMAIVTYVAVLYPVSFARRLSLRAVYVSVNVIFIVSFALSIPLAIFQAAIVIPGTVDCTNTNCAPLILLINFLLVTGSLFFSVSTFSFVIFSLTRHRRKLKEIDAFSNTSLDSAVRLLVWTFFTIILITVAEIVPFVTAANKKQRDFSMTCHEFYKSSALIGESVVTLLESSIWSIALIIDPLANIFFDKTVYARVAEQMRWIRTSCFRTSQSPKT